MACGAHSMKHRGSRVMLMLRIVSLQRKENREGREDAQGIAKYLFAALCDVSWRAPRLTSETDLAQKQAALMGYLFVICQATRS
jgi:hypothetical protein